MKPFIYLFSHPQVVLYPFCLSDPMKDFLLRSAKFIHSKAVTRVLLVITLVSVAWYFVFRIDWSGIGNISVDWKWFAMATLVQGVFLLGGSFLWFLVTCSCDVALGLVDTLAIRVYSNFGKYLPLQVAGIGYRIGVYKARTEKPATRITQASYLEFLNSMLSGSLVFVGLFFLHSGAAQELFSLKQVFGYVGFVAVLLFFFCPVTQKKMFDICFGVFGIKDGGHLVCWRKMAVLLAVSCCYWFIAGTSLFCLVKAFCPTLGWDMFLTVCMYQVFAICLGNVSFFAPSGVGVREGVLLVGLSGFLPQATAGTVVIVARVLATAVDLVGIFLSFLYLEHQKNSSSK